jgi:hypothetical protein
VEVALRVMQVGAPVARETTMHLLLLDPYSPAHFTGEDRLAILSLGLADEEGEVRGLAADALADEAPERLRPDLARWQRDPDERVRMAAWDVAFADGREQAGADAQALLVDDSAPLAARRTALIALGAALSTAEITPLLAAVVAHPDPVLAEDAANLLWSHHRAPTVAEAASRSPHAAVRQIANRLLHPDFGSPAAGGSRPGAPDARTDVYGQMIRGFRERDREQQQY